MREAEELLGTEKTRSFAKGLFFGRFEPDLLFPYPTLSTGDQAELERYLDDVRGFFDREVDSAAIDKESRIPDRVLQGLFDLGVMTMSIPVEFGGKGLSQQAYCRVVEEIGARDAGIAVLVNAHQSIGLKGLLLFATPQQREHWLRKLVNERHLAAFALTEPNAGSDAGGIQTRAVLNSEGTHYILNGEKQWITNGGVAGLLTVMAKVPGTQDSKGREQITSFLVTPDMPGFHVVEKAMEKVGIRGTWTARLRFENMAVPVENILGPPGKGLRVALTLLDYGRTTFGATCTGVAKRCVADSIRHARTRQQFRKPLGHFELVKAKLAKMAALAFAMESGTYLTAGMIDRGLEDYMVETAILKVFASEALWDIIYDTMQIFGGLSFFTDKPYERMMRDARLNQIGEGANDVLRTFIALVGMRDVGMSLKEVLDAVKSPLGGLGKITDFARRHIPGQDAVRIPIRRPELADMSHQLEDVVRTFGKTVEGQLMRYREDILEKQYVQSRIADAATEVYMMSAVLARLESVDPTDPAQRQKDLAAGRHYFQMADRQIRRRLHELNDNLDAETTQFADSLLAES